jgi:hypothetical protein
MVNVNEFPIFHEVPSTLSGWQMPLGSVGCGTPVEKDVEEAKILDPLPGIFLNPPGTDTTFFIDFSQFLP